MANHAQGPETSLPAGEPPLQGDARVLRDAIGECIRTSPDAFGMTPDEFEKKSADYWQYEVRTATWAVIEAGEEVIGIAAARHPDPAQDADVDQDTARFIASAWINPEHRRSRKGRLLLEFLFEEERRRHPQVNQFLLWVFEDNRNAINFYNRMGFKYTGVSKKHEPSSRTERRYRNTWNSSSNQVSQRPSANEIYRILNAE